MPSCERCGKEGLATIMSIFNTDMICLECKEKERRHPRYQEAVEAEQDAVRRGDYNFPGIGKPDDLEEVRMIPGAKFPLGRLVMTTHLEAVLKESDPQGWQDDLNQMVAQHALGEWGEMSEGDKELNEEGLAGEGRLHSAYTSRNGIKVWIITEWDRSVTTCLLPEDY